MTSNVVVQNITPPTQSMTAMQQQRVLHGTPLRHGANTNGPGLPSQHVYDTSGGNGMAPPQASTGSGGGGMPPPTGTPQNYQNMMTTGGPGHANYGSYAQHAQQQSAQQIHIRQMYGQASGAVRASGPPGGPGPGPHSGSLGRTNMMVNGGGSAAPGAARGIRQSHPG